MKAPALGLIPEELVVSGITLWVMLALALFCYTKLFELGLCYWRKQRIQWVKQWLNPLMKLVSTLPLLGLLGTIIGLMDTLAAQYAGVDIAISDGISKALFTTQAGLLLCIPAIVLLWSLKQYVEAQDET